jgi:sugar O-acyltransferase (sialic acid O-acetyltransferase NeuD family)
MLVFGAGGFAKEVLNILKQNKFEDITFYDDVNDHQMVYDKYVILKTEDAIKNHFANQNNEFIIGIGGIKTRRHIFDKLTQLGGITKTIKSTNSYIGDENITIGDGSVIFDGVSISNNVSIGKCSIVYYNAVVTHDCKIGDFVQISPSCNILGRVEIGDNTFLGANCTILPDVKIGHSVVIGAGAVVTKDVLDNEIVMGVPAKKISKS